MARSDTQLSNNVIAAGYAAARRRVLIVDDNAGMRRMLRSLFEPEGFSVSEAATESEVLKELQRSPISLITLDLTLSGEDGLAIARSVRARSDVPIIMVTAKCEEVDRIVGLEVGADDYITKPFNVREVLARVRAVLRRTEKRAPLAVASEADGLSFEGFVFHPAERRLTAKSGKAIPLTSREFRLLEAFVRRPSRVLSRDQLIDLVGGQDSEPLERAIDTLVARLRRKIEADPGQPSLIKTVRGEGYVFAARVAPI